MGKINRGETFKLVTLSLIAVVLILSYLNVSASWIDKIGNWITGIFINSIFSTIAGSLVEESELDLLKKWSLNWPIKIGEIEFNVSITLFVIGTVIVSFFIFGKF